MSRWTPGSKEWHAERDKGQHVRMVIGECLGDEQLAEFKQLYADYVQSGPTLSAGFVSARLLTEEGGNMAVSETTWATREDCLRYHSSRSFRMFAAATQHLLAGHFVVKIFRTEG